MLSIIIPTLNEEKYLPLVLGEIKKQNFSDYELIVADAGSKDKTLEIAKNFGCKIVKGGLPAKGRNEGAKIAKGELLLFMDADNVYLPENFLGNLVQKFKKRNLGVAAFPILPDGKKIDKFLYRIYNWLVKITQNFLPHATNSILVKKEIHQKISGFDEEIKIAEDHEYVRRAKKYGYKYGFIEIEPVLTSSRRFEKDGRLKTYLKYILAGFHLFIFGKIKTDLYHYQFDKNKKI